MNCNMYTNMYSVNDKSESCFDSAFSYSVSIHRITEDWQTSNSVFR